MFVGLPRCQAIARSAASAWHRTPLQLLKFSTSFVETRSKVTEVLAFVESISQGPIRLREAEPKSQTHLWAAGQLQAPLLIMEKVRRGFDCAHIRSAKLMIRDEQKKKK